MAFRMLNGVYTVGASPSLNLDEVCGQHTVQVSYIDTANITAMTVVLQATADNPSIPDATAKWSDLITYALLPADITAKGAMFHVVNKPVQRIRVNITILTGAVLGNLITVKYIPNINV